MSYASLDDLRSQLGAKLETPESAAYAAKMLHSLPAYTVVDRAVFILQRCAGKRVLEFGASGAMHDGIVKVAAVYMGVDREDGPNICGFDLDAMGWPALPMFRESFAGPFVTLSIPEIIVCGEVLEHLGNPLWFLTRLQRQYPDVPLIVTVPNAFSSAAAKWIERGVENVNLDHVAWYSPTTLRVLLTRAGYTSGSLYFYNGDGPRAEGLIMVTE